MDAVFSIVEPEDVRWIYLSHEDHDHIGNLRRDARRCPNATLVTTWFMVERLHATTTLPIERMRWVNDGERFSAGDRTLTCRRAAAVRLAHHAWSLRPFDRRLLGRRLLRLGDCTTCRDVNDSTRASGAKASCSSNAW